MVDRTVVESLLSSVRDYEVFVREAMPVKVHQRIDKYMF